MNTNDKVRNLLKTMESVEGNLQTTRFTIAKMLDGCTILSPEDASSLRAAYPRLIAAGCSSNYTERFRTILSIESEENEYPKWVKYEETDQLLKYRIQTSEPIYEWQWKLGSHTDGWAGFSPFMTDEEAQVFRFSKLTPLTRYEKDESTKRERK